MMGRVNFNPDYAIEFVMRRQNAINQKFIFEKHSTAMVKEDKLSKTTDLQQFVLVIEFLLHISGLNPKMDY